MISAFVLASTAVKGCCRTKLSLSQNTPISWYMHIVIHYNDMYISWCVNRVTVLPQQFGFLISIYRQVSFIIEGYLNAWSFSISSKCLVCVSICLFFKTPNGKSMSCLHKWTIVVVVSVSELQEGVTTGGHQQTLNGILRNQTFGKVENYYYYCHLLTKAVDEVYSIYGSVAN